MRNKPSTAIAHYDAFERMTFGRKIINAVNGMRTATYVFPSGTVLHVHQINSLHSLDLEGEEILLMGEYHEQYQGSSDHQAKTPTPQYVRTGRNQTFKYRTMGNNNSRV